jgi:hypothetical protein
MEKLFEMFIANLPILLSVIAALGIWQAGAAAIRKFVSGWRKDAAKSATKVDDALVAVIGPALEVLADALEHGDKEKAINQIRKINLAMPKK